MSASLVPSQPSPSTALSDDPVRKSDPEPVRQPVVLRETVSSDPGRPGGEPLARIEDKASRIEEKLARSEASMQRVVDRFELASARMNEVALQADLAALRGEVAAVSRRVRRSAGPGALAVTAVATAILAAIAVVLALRYAPALVGR